MPNLFDLICGNYAIWECNHCTERRVWGNIPPPRDPNLAIRDDHPTALLRCQVSGENELHTYVEMSGRWVGKPCPLKPR